jgi:nucleoside-diphosphate kinase
MTERTLVLIKPDAVQRKLIGEIIARFERVGLKFEEMKITIPTTELVGKHYLDHDSWLSSIGKKTIDTYQKYHLHLKTDLDTENALEIGRIIRGWLIQYITSGPVVAMVISGNHAIEVVRKMVGNTAPLFADLGTIRGDYSIDSPDLADREKRAIKNLVHASGTPEEAEREISLWFG